jgi:hypothetical protein
MSEDKDREQDRLTDNWLKSWEDQCIAEFDNEPDNMEDRAQLDREESSQKLWLLFQNSASAVAQLYKGIIIDLLWRVFFLFYFISNLL